MIALRQEGNVNREAQLLKIDIALLTEGGPSTSAPTINIALLTEGGPSTSAPTINIALLTEGALLLIDSQRWKETRR